MAKKQSYPLRISEDVLKAMKVWSDDELRSLNAQIEYVLRDALRRAGRLKPNKNKTADSKAQEVPNGQSDEGEAS